MRISDWSSDVCSSDLRRAQPFGSTPVVVDGRRRSFPYTGNLYHVAHGDHTLVFACGRTHRSLPFGSIAMHPLSELPRTHRVPSKRPAVTTAATGSSMSRSARRHRPEIGRAHV